MVAAIYNNSEKEIFKVCESQEWCLTNNVSVGSLAHYMRSKYRVRKSNYSTQVVKPLQI